MNTTQVETGEFIGVINPRQDLGIRLDDVGPGYADSEFNVYRSEWDGETVFNVSADHIALDGLALYKFLEATVPSPGQDIRAILTDWSILNFKLKTGLVEMHKVIGRPWEEFELSFRAFETVMHDALSPKQPRGDYLRDEKRMLYDSLYEVAGVISQSVSSILSALEQAGLKWAATHLNEIIINEANLYKSPYSPNFKSIEAAANWYNQLDPGKKQFIAISILRGLPKELKDRMAQSEITSRYEVITTEEENVVGYPRRLIKGSLEQAYKNRSTVNTEGFDINSVEVADDSGNTKRVYVPGSAVRLAKPTIVPVISWKKDKQNNREFVIKRSTTEGDAPVYYDGILGALVVAYLSPEVRGNEKLWPKRLGLTRPDKTGALVSDDAKRSQSFSYDRTNSMGAAQVPVLVLAQQRHILSSDFVAAVEKLAA